MNIPEQSSRQLITIDSAEELPFHLSLHGRKSGKPRRFNLGMKREGFGEGVSREAQDLIRTLMLAHLIAPYFPQIIETNFPVQHTGFINALYDHYHCRPPKIRKGSDQVSLRYAETDIPQTFRVEHASAHSGGLDSAYRLTSLLQKGESVLAIHIRNLNAKTPSEEAAASEEQSKIWGIPYMQEPILNSSGNSGYDVMVTRDLLLGAICAVDAAPHGAMDVLIEGGMGDNPDTYHFSEYVGAWVLFNRLAKDVGLNLEVVGVDPGDIETIREVVLIEQELGIPILPLVQNCFSALYQIENSRKKWKKYMPQLAAASPHQWCGSCHKCRRMTLGRIHYDPRFAEIPEKELALFVQDTYHWIKKYPQNVPHLSESFMRHLEMLERRVRRF